MPRHYSASLVVTRLGLPETIRTDNGIPFSCANARFGLSRLSVWWLRLGIDIERIKPSHPEQNGRHEHMHLTLTIEATKPAAENFLQQQARFDDRTGLVAKGGIEPPTRGFTDYLSDLFCVSFEPVTGAIVA